MNKFRFWIPCLIGAILTPLFFYGSTLSGDGAASHAGGGFQIFLFYPFPFLTAIILGARINSYSIYSQVVFIFSIGLAVIQFPLFGFVLSYANLKKDSVFFTLIKILVVFHTIVSMLGLLLVLISLT